MTLACSCCVMTPRMYLHEKIAMEDLDRSSVGLIQRGIEPGMWYRMPLHIRHYRWRSCSVYRNSQVIRWNNKGKALSETLCCQEFRWQLELHKANILCRSRKTLVMTSETTHSRQTVSIVSICFSRYTKSDYALFHRTPLTMPTSSRASDSTYSVQSHHLSSRHRYYHS